MDKNKNSNLLIFLSSDNYYAIDAMDVERVIRAVEITAVPNAPFILYGMFDLKGKTIPVVSIRRLFSLDEKSIELDDMLIIFNTTERLIALLTDHVAGVFECAKENSTDASELFPEIAPKAIVKWSDKLVPVIDIESIINEEIFHHLDTHLTKDEKAV